MSIIVNFLELDHMRKTIRDFAKENGIRIPARKKAPWDKSRFYIGRNVVRFYFKDVGFMAAPGLRDRLRKRLLVEYGLDYIIKTDGLDVSLVMRSHAKSAL